MYGLPIPLLPEWGQSIRNRLSGNGLFENIFITSIRWTGASEGSFLGEVEVSEYFQLGDNNH